ncbi:MAG: nucleoside monophosphate kinase [Candidatus Eremiobacteraeota bacterium]|nr:nucleoside monophosphate kinase [Candidatus Eremiobacteraeota bacterium]
MEQRFGARQIATGDILRDNIQNETELGIAARAFVETGGLVPDELVIKMIETELADSLGFVMDGFPRTVTQAQAFDAFLKAKHLDLNAVIYFRGDSETLIQRLQTRWTNPRTGRTYNTVSNPPRVAGIDDDDGGPLIAREDDRRETVAKRLDVFQKQTAPLIQYYRDAGALVEVDGLLDVAHVTRAIEDALDPASVPT